MQPNQQILQQQMNNRMQMNNHMMAQSMPAVKVEGAWSVESAGRAAAVADGVVTIGSNNGMGMGVNKPPDAVGGVKRKRDAGLRRGKWTPEEEAYASRLIQEFRSGLLPLTDGTTLRTFLSKLLNCDPMRISKKFVGTNCIGKQVFRRRQAEMDQLSTEQIEKNRGELAELELRFLERVAQNNRCRGSGVAPKEALALPHDGGQPGAQMMQLAAPMAVTPPWMMPPQMTAAQAV
ncbi:unnamed protein product, partial [Chrysoparadoxa australica]